jgi:hypothetical protein
MGFSDLHGSILGSAAVSARVPKLPPLLASLRKKLRLTREHAAVPERAPLGAIRAGTLRARISELTREPWIATLGLGIVATVLGALAHQASRESSLRRWFRENRPPMALWQQLSRSRGYTEAVEPEARQPALRTLPYGTDPDQEASSVWTTHDRGWLAVFSADIESGEPALYRRPGAPSPKEWQLVGAGWQGLQRWAEDGRVAADHGLTEEKAALSRSKTPRGQRSHVRLAQNRAQRASPPLDPRALRY